MKSLLIRLYPARWRARYGDEFLALLEARPLGPFDVADILLGALDAQLRRRGRGADTQHERGFTMSLRRGGLAAIIGAPLWTAGFVISNGTFGNVDLENSGGPAGRGITGTAAQGDEVTDAFFLGLLTFFVGSLLFAIVTYRTAVLSRRAAVLLGVAPVLAFAGGGGGGFGDILILSGLIFFAMAWVALGVQAIRLDRPATEPRPA